MWLFTKFQNKTYQLKKHHPQNDRWDGFGCQKNRIYESKRNTRIN
ncbi:hypothetical protein ADIS_2377 [Lunatimonas lonarensis]|uniref:Uncharacterized protein n=1 Tax=Lunatimonas lonarensis TaxID=1232681 RepID=R7ZSW1_9BACT|nr:hypothetical protein ADIS_2377 [Lunatimonas lonarensis]